MKTSLYMALVGLMTVASISSYAIPPVPPSVAATSAPQIVVCVDFNSLSSEDLTELEKGVQENPEKIISLDEETREICFSK